MRFVDFGGKSDNLKGRNGIYRYLPVMGCYSEHIVADLFYKKITLLFVKTGCCSQTRKATAAESPPAAVAFYIYPSSTSPMVSAAFFCAAVVTWA